MAKRDAYSPLPPTQAEPQHFFSSEQMRSEDVVLDCLSMLAASVHLDTAIDSFLETLGCFYEAGQIFLFHTDYESNTVTSASSWPKLPDASGSSVLLSQFDPWIAAFESEGALCLSSADDPRLAPLLSFCPAASSCILAAPMYTDTVLSGFLCVVDPTQHLTDLKVLLAVANLSTVELHKLHLMKQVDYLHHKDPLTDVYNRRSYMSSLAKIYQPAPYSIGVLIASVNGLKTVNAVLGLSFGDSVVQQTAETMKEILHVRIYRISGDEFVALHPDIGAEVFHSLVHSLQSAFDTSGNCSVSIGASWADRDVDVHALLLQADQQLSEKKKATAAAAF